MANKYLRVDTMREIICDILAPVDINKSKEDQKYLFHYVSREGPSEKVFFE